MIHFVPGKAQRRSMATPYLKAQRRQKQKGTCYSDRRQLNPIRYGYMLLLFVALQHSPAILSEEHDATENYAKNSNAKQLYLEGINAFKNSNFNLALDLFLQAQKGGYLHARLHYNIGVTYFKLNNYSQAYKALNKANDDPTIAFLVNLNIGLVAHKLGKLNLAKSRFESAYKLANGEQQQAIARHMLNKLGVIKMIPSEKNMHANILFAYGYTDNISLINPLFTLDQTRQNDYFSSLYGNLKYNLQPWLDIHALLYALQYKNENEYDFADLRLLFMLKPLSSNKKFGIGLEFEKNYLAGQLLQNIGSVSIKSVFQRPQGLNLGITYEFKDIATADDRFDYLSGSLQRLKFNLKLKNRFDVATSFFYEYEFNRRNDESEVINGIPIFTSHSPNRHKFGLSTLIPISNNQKLMLNFEYRNSKYRDPSSNIDDAIIINLPPLLPPQLPSPLPPSLPPDLLLLFPDVRRKDRRNRTTLKWLYKLNSKTKLYIGYDYISNQSNIKEFTYNSRRADIGLMWNY